MNRYKYKKVFTRDQTLTEDESWYFAHDKGIECWYGGERPEMVPMILYMFDGAEETWHSVDQYKWIQDILQKQIKLNKNIVHDAIIQYEKKMVKVKAAWTLDKLNSIDEIEEFINNFFAAAPYFPVWYYAAVDERTPRDIRKEAMNVRNHDLFYDECDRIVRNTYRHLFPQLKGYEAAILKNEIRNLPDIEVLQKRKQNFVFIPGRAAEIITIEEYLKSHPEIILIEETVNFDQKKEEIKGQIGYPGRVRGRAKVIRRLDQMDKIKKGDILVIPMTTPNFLAAMKKAAGFITDEGGVTCHAAIVAREMNKPCIIGTKIATKVLKDGDLVEVDANKGIVRKLK